MSMIFSPHKWEMMIYPTNGMTGLSQVVDVGVLTQTLTTITILAM